MAFHLGSLGFLTSFRFQDFRDKITKILEGEFDFLWPQEGLQEEQAFL